MFVHTWSPKAVKRVTGYDLEGKAKENGGIIHLLNSGAACLDACGECRDENGNAIMKKWWEVTEEDIKKMTDATVWCEAGFDNFRGGYSSRFVTKAEMPVTMIRLNLVDGLGPMLQIAERVRHMVLCTRNNAVPCTNAKFIIHNAKLRRVGNFQHAFLLMRYIIPFSFLCNN